MRSNGVSPTSPQRTRVAVIDSFPQFTQCLKELLDRACALEIIHTTAKEIYQTLDGKKPDLLLLSVERLGRTERALLKHLYHRPIRTRTVLLASVLSDADVLAVIRCGVAGIVPSERASEELLPCITTVAQGGRWLELGSTARILEELVKEDFASPKNDVPIEWLLHAYNREREKQL
jgi:DNA-binding NarL/FixJ family response regulator